jgi:glycosyltransferase involved in cell wall biosynthesis
MMSERVEILMATYLSADYLGPMLESLQAQSHDDFHLVVSDDGSRDGTMEILAAFAPRFRNPVRIIRRETPSGSAMANFASLLEAATGDYVFLADHDDIWLPEKVARGVAMLRAAEAEEGMGLPLMLHTDLEGMDGEGRPLFPSYWAYKLTDPAVVATLSGVLLQPGATGCTIAANRALLERALPVPEGAIMHDWWLNLVAAGFGRVLHDPVPQVRYRIHGGNASRPQTARFTLAPGMLGRARDVRRGIRRRYVQGAAFRERFGPALPPSRAAVLDRFVALAGTPPALRQWRLIRGGFLGTSGWRNLVQVVLA